LSERKYNQLYKQGHYEPGYENTQMFHVKHCFLECFSALRETTTHHIHLLKGITLCRWLQEEDHSEDVYYYLLHAMKCVQGMRYLMGEPLAAIVIYGPAAREEVS